MCFFLCGRSVLLSHFASSSTFWKLGWSNLRLYILLLQGVLSFNIKVFATFVVGPGPFGSRRVLAGFVLLFAFFSGCVYFVVTCDLIKLILIYTTLGAGVILLIAVVFTLSFFLFAFGSITGATMWTISVLLLLSLTWLRFGLGWRLSRLWFRRWLNWVGDALWASQWTVALEFSFSFLFSEITFQSRLLPGIQRFGNCAMFRSRTWLNTLNII